jgi:hypothetical protein
LSAPTVLAVAVPVEPVMTCALAKRSLAGAAGAWEDNVLSCSETTNAAEHKRFIMRSVQAGLTMREPEKKTRLDPSSS